MGFKLVWNEEFMAELTAMLKFNMAEAGSFLVGRLEESAPKEVANSFTSFVEDETVYVVSNAPQIVPIETGTVKTPAKPFMLPVLQEESDNLAKIISQGS